MALPANATKANLDNVLDDPKLARTDLTDLVDKFNALLVHLNLSASTADPIAVPIPVAQGGTGSTTAPAARTALGASTIGSTIFTAADAAAVRTALDAAALGQSQSWSAGQTPHTQTITDGATITWNLASGQVGAVVCAAARTFAAPTNQVANRFYALSIQNSGGAYAHAFNSAFIFDSNDGTPPSFPANARLHLIFRSDGTNMREWGRRVVAS